MRIIKLTKLKHSKYQRPFTRICFIHLILVGSLLSSTTMLMAEDALKDKKPSQDVLKEISLEGLLDLPFIEISTGTAVPIEKAPSVASVITAEDIKAMGAYTLEEVLETVPGIHVSPSVLTSDANFVVRGVKTSLTSQILILFNGYRISSDVHNGILGYGSKMNLENIARIEVLRGPGSAIYGADAYSGVVNIITKSAKDINGLHAAVRGGANNTENFWTQYGGKLLDTNWDIAVNFEYFKQKADKSRTLTSDAQTLFDGLFGTSASLAPSYFDDRYDSTNFNLHVNNENWKIGFNYQIQNEVGSGFGLGQAIDHEGFAKNEQTLFLIEYNDNIWTDGLNFTGKLSYLETKLQANVVLFPPGTTVLIGADGNLFTSGGGLVTFTDGVIASPGRVATTPKLDLTFLYSKLNDHKIRVNFGAKYEESKPNESKNFGTGVIDGTISPIDGTLTDVTGTPYIYIADKKRTIKYISLQDVWDIALDWTFTAGVRYDYYSDFGSTTNPRLALVWTTTDKLTSKLLYATSFRAPSFSELFSQNNPVALGNENLDPETVTTTELAFSYQASANVSSGISFYHYKTKDMISFTEVTAAGLRAENINSLTGSGIELEVGWRINHEWSLHANYAYQKTINDRTNTQSPFIPKQQVFADLRWKFKPGWVASAQINHVADRERETTDVRNKIDDYTLVNMTIRRKDIRIFDRKSRWEAALTVKNLFNTDAREPTATGTLGPAYPNDIPLNERRMYFEIRHKF